MPWHPAPRTAGWIVLPVGVCFIMLQQSRDKSQIPDTVVIIEGVVHIPPKLTNIED